MVFPCNYCPRNYRCSVKLSAYFLRIHNLTHIGQDVWKEREQIHLRLKKILSVTDPIFTKLTIVRKLFVKNTYTIFYGNPATYSVADTRSQTDRYGLPIVPSFFNFGNSP